VFTARRGSRTGRVVRHGNASPATRTDGTGPGSGPADDREESGCTARAPALGPLRKGGPGGTPLATVSRRPDSGAGEAAQFSGKGEHRRVGPYPGEQPGDHPDRVDRPTVDLAGSAASNARTPDEQLARLQPVDHRNVRRVAGQPGLQVAREHCRLDTFGLDPGGDRAVRPISLPSYAKVHCPFYGTARGLRGDEAVGRSASPAEHRERAVPFRSLAYTCPGRTLWWCWCRAGRCSMIGAVRIPRAHRFATAQIEADRQVELWERHNAESLIALACRPPVATVSACRVPEACPSHRWRPRAASPTRST